MRDVNTGFANRLRHCNQFRLVFLLILVFPLAANAGDVAVLGLSNAAGQIMGSHVDVYEDVERELTLNQVVEPGFSGNFKPVEKAVPSFGYSDSAYWLRLRVWNELDHDSSWILEVAYPPLDVVELYIEKTAGGYQSLVAGDSLNFNIRDILHHAPAFRLSLDADQSKTIYLRVVSTSSLQIPIILWTEKAFEAKRGLELMFWGLYFGGLLVMALYNAFLFVSIHDRAYLLYVFYVSAIVAFQLVVNGLASQYFWPETPGITNHFLLISLNVLGIFAAWFSLEFLKLREHAPLLCNILRGFIAMFVLVMLLAFVVKYSVALKVTIVCFATGVPVLVVAGMVCWHIGFRPAKFYLLAWAMLLAGTFIYALKTLGVLDANYVTNYAVTIGSALDLVLLSLALGDRVSNEKKEKLRAQQKSYAAQEELLKTKEEAIESLQQADRIKNEFLSTISHEFRTPMNGIIGCIQLLEHEHSSQRARDVLQHLDDSAENMLALVNRVLGFVQLNGGDVQVSEGLFHLDSLILPLQETIGKRCANKGVAFSIEIGEQVPKYLISDKTKIAHILEDLLDNAVKYTALGTVQLTVSATPVTMNESETLSSHRFIFKVTDSGQGITASARERIFEMFSQAQGGFDRSHDGLGLGLAICQRYARILNGEIQFETESGKGSVFELALTIQAAQKIEGEEFVGEATDDELSSARVLIVEDNPTNQMILVGMLKKMGLESAVAGDGYQALETLNRQSVDLILMDCQMPGLDGFETTQRIRKGLGTISEIPIIAVTANAMAGDRERCLAVGMSDYLAKPVKSSQLQAKIKLWLSGSAMRKSAPEAHKVVNLKSSQ